MNDFITIMRDRGFIKDASFDIAEFQRHFSDKPIVAYIGFDLTAPSLHVGSLIQLMVLRWLKKTGPRTGNMPLVLMGEATTRIGDPSGKDSARQMLSSEQIDQNRTNIVRVIDRIVGQTKIVSNAKWFHDNGPSFMSFLTEYGPHFTINRMMTFDSVKSRLDREQPLTLLEFSYMLLQAVDFLELNRRYNVNMQIGGSDQWGNICNGLDIIRRKEPDQTVFAMTTPLLLDSSGNKMGKSQGKPIWLDAEMTSVFDFFQYWRNVDDADVDRFLLLFTDDTHAAALNEQFAYAADVANDPAATARFINRRKEMLAFWVTEMVHGQEAAEQALEQAKAIFERGDMMVTARSITVSGQANLVSLLVQAGLASSKSDAKRLIAGNAISIDGVKVSDDQIIERPTVLKAGKQAPVKVEVVNGID